MVVPRDDGVGRQLTTFLLRSDVTELDGPTKVVPPRVGKILQEMVTEVEDLGLYDIEPLPFGR